jgi:hypothetical protein
MQVNMDYSNGKDYTVITWVSIRDGIITIEKQEIIKSKDQE